MSELTFTPVQRGKTVSIARFSDEFLAQIKEVWENAQTEEYKGFDWTVEFPDVDAKDKWANWARKYGAAEGFRFRKINDDPESRVLNFRLTPEDEYQEAKAKREAAAADLAARKARGEVITRGRKPKTA